MGKKFKIGDKVLLKNNIVLKDDRLFRVCKLWLDNYELPIYELCSEEENHSHERTSKIFVYETEIKKQ
jgi:hypothetical protein